MGAAHPQASHCFGFEQDFVGSWRCIPLCLRRKLDLIGLKLKLSHWLELRQEQRQQLVDWPDHPEGLAELRETLRQWTSPMADGEAKPLPPAVAEPWQQPFTVPQDVARAALGHSIALGGPAWGSLGELERFALCKLARPGHDHPNFRAALDELLNGPP
ncbi:MAG: nitrate reductase [Synechococcaceae bacterium WB9_2_170]|nr:nitrate reductase [Synechococcaceae bacterium WB9_2_170]